ncbi:MAG: rhomboid family intramembrane serine protease [Planctomycetota bacterium]
MKTLLIVNAAVFLVNAVLAGRISDLMALSWSGLAEGYGLGVLRLLSYQFVHSYADIFHILLNMLVLFFFGTMVETEVGRKGLYRLYVISGLVGAVIQLLFGLAMGIDPQIVGASGACYGIMVYAAFMAPRMRVIFIIFPLEMRWLVGFLVFIGVYSTLISFQSGASGGVAHGAHLGGALWGFLAFRYFRNFYVTADFRSGGLKARIQSWQQGRAHKAEASRRETLDRLLDKVHAQGIDSLSKAERRFLENESRRKR